MKIYSILFICLISYSIVYSNFFDDNKIYLTSEMDFGNYIGYDINLNIVNKETYSLKIGYNLLLQKPRTIPENFKTGIINVLFFGLGNPYDKIINYQITFGKINSFNKSGTIRSNLSIGLGYSFLVEPVNWKPVDEGIIVSNYKWEYAERTKLSLVINYKLEFLIRNFAGLTISPKIILNSERVYYGVGFGMLIGYLRD